MKVFLRIYFLTLISIFFSFDAYSQLETILDFDGRDFEFIPKKIISHGDSLFVITQGDGVNDFGKLFRIDNVGNGYTVIKSFDSEANSPRSMISDDNFLYGTTRFSSSGTGKLFRYTFGTGEFGFLKEFDFQEGQDVELKYVTDTVIWGYSQNSSEDVGSIFTINLSDTSFTKIYNNTSTVTGQNPTDICIVNDEIFITFFNGGGIPYDDGGGSTFSGSIAKVEVSGSNFITLIQGQDLVGTQPRSLINYDNKIYGLFTSAGSDNTAKLFSFNYDGTGFNALLDLDNVGRGKLTVLNDSIFGITSDGLFGFELTSSSDTLLTNFSLETGRDAVAYSAVSSKEFIVGVQQGGMNGGGGLLRFRKNALPKIVNSIGDQLFQENFDSTAIDLTMVFIDPDGDDLIYSPTSSDESILTVEIVGDELKVHEVSNGTAMINIIVDDSREGVIDYSFDFTINASPQIVNPVTDITLPNGFTTHSIDLSTTFTDPDGDALSIIVENSVDSVITIGITGTQLTISEVNPGISTITLNVDDGKGGSINDEFMVEVEEPLALSDDNNDLMITIYPNPTSNLVRIIQPLNKPFDSVRIYDLKGSLKSTIDIKGKFEINLPNLRPGIYLFKFSGKNTVTRRVIVK